MRRKKVGLRIDTTCSALTALALWLAFAPSAGGQQLLPRAYWPTPIGTNVVTLLAGRTAGDFVSGGMLPITDGESRITLVQISYARSFDLAGRTATVFLMAPYLRGTAEGVVDGDYRRRDLSGLADLSARLVVNLVGAPAMDGVAFGELVQNPKPQVGVSVEVDAPSGRYDGSKVINLGSNRWSLRPALGAIVPTGRGWTAEFELAATLFGDNDDFGGAKREQDPLFAVASHFVYRVRRGFWTSLDVNYYTGGRTTVDGVVGDDEQESARVGATAFFPFKKRHSVRLALSRPFRTKFGGDFGSATMSYSFLWR